MGSASRSRLVCFTLSLGLLVGSAFVRPAEARSAHAEVTKASWYGRGLHGKRTASGVRFDSGRLTAAHRTLRLGSKVRVTELNTGRSVVVQINDRGPYVHGRGIDLSYAAARQLGILDRGVARVKIEMVRPEAPAAPVTVASAATEAAPWWPRAIIR